MNANGGGPEASDDFTPLPKEQRETCEVRRVEIRRVCKDVRKLKERKPTLAQLQGWAIAALGAAGTGAAGLLNFYGTDAEQRPSDWVEIVWYGVVIAGLISAFVLWRWKASERDSFSGEIDRIAEDIETLDY